MAPRIMNAMRPPRKSRRRWLIGGAALALLGMVGWRLSTMPSMSCRLGREDACSIHAEALGRAGHADEAHSIYAGLCGRGRASACLAAGRIDWTAGRPSEAITMWQRGCEKQQPAGDPEADVPCPPVVWARSATACEHGDASACRTRDLLGLKHQLVEREPACSALVPRCRAGEEEACAVLGWRCR